MTTTTRIVTILAVLFVPATCRAGGTIASAADTYITHDDATATWTIGNARIVAAIRVERGGELRLVHLTNPATGYAWELNGGSDAVATINGKSADIGAVEAGYQLAGVSTATTDRSVELVVAYDHRETHLRVSRHYLVYAGVPAVEAWTAFAGPVDGGAELSDLTTWCYSVAGQHVEWINGLLGDSADVAHNDAFSQQQRDVADGAHLEMGSGGRSSERTLPYFKITRGADALVGGLLWSGAWRLMFDGQGSGAQVTFGLSEMTTTVTPARAVETPHGFLAVATAADSAAAVAAYVIDGLREGRPFAALVTYNTWFAYGTRVDERVVRDEIDRTASLGVELFVLDAGWYPGAGRDGIYDFTSGLGKWSADDARFPSGLRALVTRAHDRGMKFGLWVEPTRVALENVGGGDFAEESWLATSAGRYDPASDTPRAAKICLSSAAARAWVFNSLVQLIDEVQPDYLKWDSNFWINCNRPGHDHGALDGNFAQVIGLYDVLAALRARYPNLLVENVSGGGNRLDYGMLRYTDVAWMDDRTAPSTLVRHNLQGLAPALPPSYLFSFVIDNPDELLHAGDDVPLYMRSRMAGVLGLTFRTADLPARVQTDIASHIALYKQLRDTIQGASIELLTRQTSLDDPPTWDAVQETDAAGRALIFAFQNDSAVETIIVRPRGLEPGAMYEVRSVDAGVLGTASGADLMANGIGIAANPQSAGHVLILSR